MSKVVVIGMGYVGLPLAVRAAEVGHEVTGVDLDLRKVNMLRARSTYIEDVTSDQIDEVIGRGQFRPEMGWTSRNNAPESVTDFDIAIITVPTPLRDNEPDLSYVESAGVMLGQVLRTGGTVVLESTTYPGTTDGILRLALESQSGLMAGLDFHLGFSPERIDPGSSIHTLQNTPKLVSATTNEGLEIIDDFYSSIVDQTVRVSNPRIAELTKLYENIQANVNIALINEVAELAHDLNIDVWEMIDASMTKGHSVARWTPGPGVGGHCLPIDPMYLAWQSRTQLDKPFRFAELADEVNNGRPRYVAARAEQMLKRDNRDIRGAQVLVLGVAYKPDVGDVRESPAVAVVESLMKLGAAVTVVDPHVEEWAWTHTPMLPADEMHLFLENYALVVLVTNHTNFDYPKIASQAQRILDCRNALIPAHNVEAL